MLVESTVQYMEVLSVIRRWWLLGLVKAGMDYMHVGLDVSSGDGGFMVMRMQRTFDCISWLVTSILR